ncbi:glycosyltransferase [Hyella patelloides]|nr:glycosyltransferase [Hyella patelloides]
MKNINLIQITEYLPPHLNGIGHYAHNLAQQLQSQYDVSTSFILIDKQKKSSLDNGSDFTTYYLSQLANSLEVAVSRLTELKAAENNTIILHFERGIYDRFIDDKFYRRYGLSFQLAKAIKKIKIKHPNTQIITNFHEFLYPSILQQRDYLLRPLQNYYMRSLLKLSDTVVCSNPVVEQQIKQLYPSVNINLIPVFSNIKEPSWEQLKTKRLGHWVLFGSTDNLKRNTINFIQHLPIIKKQLPINQVNIIGGSYNPSIIELVKQLKKSIINVDYHPNLSNKEVSKFFAQAQFCYQYYFNTPQAKNPGLIFKSGVFANASAHGVISVMGNQGIETALNYLNYPGFIYMQNNSLQINSQFNFDLWSKEIHNWYQQYCSLSQAAKTFETIIKQNLSCRAIKQYASIS